MILDMLQPIWLPEGLYRAIPRATSIAAGCAGLLMLVDPGGVNLALLLALGGYSAWVYAQRMLWQGGRP
jgi:hypothetical protein